MSNDFAPSLIWTTMQQFYKSTVPRFCEGRLGNGMQNSLLHLRFFGVQLGNPRRLPFIVAVFPCDSFELVHAPSPPTDDGVARQFKTTLTLPRIEQPFHRLLGQGNVSNNVVICLYGLMNVSNPLRLIHQLPAPSSELTPVAVSCLRFSPPRSLCSVINHPSCAVVSSPCALFAGEEDSSL